jgi:hypothetical protein
MQIAMALCSGTYVVCRAKWDHCWSLVPSVWWKPAQDDPGHALSGVN